MNPLLRKIIQIILLALIIIGVGLIFTQHRWVPKVVDYILKMEAGTGYQYGDPVPPLPPVKTATSTVPKPKPAPAPVPVIDSGVQGTVTIGPTCPVVRYPEDPACADKPYQTTLVISSNIPGRSGGILVQTDSKGYFSRDLAPGTYTIRAQTEAVMPRMSPETFEVLAHKRTTLNLQFDSGIR